MQSFDCSAEQQRLASVIKSVHHQLRQKAKAGTLCNQLVWVIAL